MNNINNNNEYNFIVDEDIYDSINEYNISKSSLNCSFSILHFNIRSISKNIHSLEMYINLLNKKPEVIVCSEAWLRCCTGFINIDGYKYYDNNSKLNKSDGVIIYIKEDLVHSFIIEEFGKLKIVSVEVIVANVNKIKISGFYRCFNYDESSFIDNMHAYLQTNRNIQHHFVIGDSNINTLNSETDYLDNFLENKYISYINTITRPSTNNNEGSCIDHIMIKSNKNLNACKFLDKITDHYPILVSFENDHNEKSTYEKLNYKSLLQLCSKVNWDRITLIKDVNSAILCLINEIQLLSAQSLKKYDKKNTPRKPWITSGLICSCNTKQKLYLKFKRNPNNSLLKSQYLEYEKKLKGLIVIAKMNYERSTVKNHDTKTLWRFVNQKLNKKQNKPNIELIFTNDVKITDERQITNQFNKFFVEIGNNLSSNLDKPVNSIDHPPPKRNEASLFLYPTHTTEVFSAINKLKNKIGGIDSIHAFTLKKIAHYITPVLVHIINLCFETGVCPEIFKTAEVVPVFKSGNKTNCSNYRPIALISNLAKVFETILYERLTDFTNQHNIINRRQFGISKNLGCKDAIAYLSDMLYYSLDKSQPTVVTFLDISKAFDSVDHDLLLQKLELVGIRGVALSLIKNYLKDRKQRVKLNNTRSDYARIKSGVPQGSILGPLLFIIYIDSLLSISENIISYADDTAVICTGSTWEQVSADSTYLLNKIYSWMYSNKLALNILKTKYIAFANKSMLIPNNLQININSLTLERTFSIKYLGIIIDENLNWKIHINSTVKKLKYLLFVFARLRYILHKTQLISIYHALFHSIATYGIIAWGAACETHVDKLIKLQNRILKIIQYRNIDQNKLPLSIRQNFFLECITNQYSHLKKLFTDSTLKTRFKSINLPANDLGIGRRNFSFVACKIFNILPKTLKNLICSEKTLKFYIKNWIKETFSTKAKVDSILKPIGFTQLILN